MADLHKIPLFPLGLVMLPDMHLPLHIFEERYKQMIAMCLASDTAFGIVLFDGQAIRQVGCMARITQVVKRYDDGRMDILTRGGARFVIKALIEEQAYMEARVRFFDDVLEDPAGDRLAAEVASALELVQEAVGDDIRPTAPDGGVDPKQLAYAIAALEGFSPVERQRFLEMTVPSERLQRCVQALSRIVTRNRLTREIRQMIGGNGSPPRSILRMLAEPADE